MVFLQHLTKFGHSRFGLKHLPDSGRFASCLLLCVQTSSCYGLCHAGRTMMSIGENSELFIMDFATLPMKVSETCSSQSFGRLRLVSRLGPDIVDVRVGALFFIQKGRVGLRHPLSFLDEANRAHPNIDDVRPQPRTTVVNGQNLG